MQKYKKYQSLLLSVAKKMKKAFAGAGEAVGPVRRTSRGRMSEREGGVWGAGRAATGRGARTAKKFFLGFGGGYGDGGAGAEDPGGPGRRPRGGGRADRAGGVWGARIRNGSGCALRNMFCRREGYLCPRCSCHCQAVRSVSSSGRSARQPRRVFASVGSAQIAVMSPARRGAKR